MSAIYDSLNSVPYQQINVYHTEPDGTVTQYIDTVYFLTGDTLFLDENVEDTIYIEHNL